MRLLVLDNFDSFTYTLVDYLHQLGAECYVVRNNVALPAITARPYDAVLLSPGPGQPENAGCLMDVVRYYVPRLPVLGVCLGHQALGQCFGARLAQAARPMHGKVSELQTLRPDPLFRGLPGRFNVTRYHSLVLENLPATLQPLARTTDEAADLMAFRHRGLPVWGVQFHPEAHLTEHGLLLLDNWLNAANARNHVLKLSIHDLSGSTGRRISIY